MIKAVWPTSPLHLSRPHSRAAKTFSLLALSQQATPLSLLATTVTLNSYANAHGYFVTPAARQPGTAYQASCGMQASYQMSGDINGNIQGLEQTVASQTDYNAAECHLWKCKRTKWAE